jgi:hypothetical protein
LKSFLFVLLIGANTLALGQENGSPGSLQLSDIFVLPSEKEPEPKIVALEQPFPRYVPGAAPFLAPKFEVALMPLPTTLEATPQPETLSPEAQAFLQNINPDDVKPLVTRARTSAIQTEPIEFLEKKRVQSGRATERILIVQNQMLTAHGEVILTPTENEGKPVSKMRLLPRESESMKLPEGNFNAQIKIWFPETPDQTVERINSEVNLSGEEYELTLNTQLEKELLQLGRTERVGGSTTAR